MKTSAFILPTMEFIGGNTETYVWNLWALAPGEKPNKEQPFNANGCTVTFSVIEFNNRFGEPLISKKCTLSDAVGDGNMSTATVTLSPSETYQLSGKFIYQVTVQGSDGETELPGQGIIYINENIDKALISGHSAATLFSLR